MTEKEKKICGKCDNVFINIKNNKASFIFSISGDVYIHSKNVIELVGDFKYGVYRSILSARNIKKYLNQSLGYKISNNCKNYDLCIDTGLDILEFKLSPDTENSVLYPFTKEYNSLNKNFYSLDKNNVKILKKLLDFTSKDINRYRLQAIYSTKNNIVATDGSIMVTTRNFFPLGCNWDNNILLPSKLINIIPDKTDFKIMEYNKDADILYIEDDDFIYMSKPVDGVYVNWEKAINPIETLTKVEYKYNMASISRLKNNKVFNTKDDQFCNLCSIYDHVSYTEHTAETTINSFPVASNKENIIFDISYLLKMWKLMDKKEKTINIYYSDVVDGDRVNTMSYTFMIDNFEVVLMPCND